MPPPLTKRERRILSAWTRAQKLKERAEAAYAKADHATTDLARKIFKFGKKIAPTTCAVRISEDGKYLLATDQYREAAFEAENGGDGKIWAHAAVRPFKLATKNLD